MVGIGLRRAALRLIFLSLGGCGEGDPPLLRVGPLAFGPEVRTQIPPDALPVLADVAAWGLAVRDGREDSILAPLAARASERSRLQTLPHLLGARGMGLSEDDLRTAYETAPEWELEVRHIVRLADGDAPMAERLEALEAAEDVLERAREGEDFAALAAQFSDEPGAAERGGLLEPGREGSWVAPFWAAAVALQPGELSGVVETEYGFHVLRLEARRAVPFAEADRARLLRRLVPEPRAAAAMEAWVAEAPAPVVAPETVSAARAALERGGVPGDLVVARLSGGLVYSGRDLAAAWAAAGPDQRSALLRGEVDAFASWLAEDVREGSWAAEAARLGAPPVAGAGDEALNTWRRKAIGWTSTFGFSPSRPDEDLRAAAIVGAGENGQEFRIARLELEGLRSLLRAAYPVETPSAVAASSSRSEIVNSVRTG